MKLVGRWLSVGTGYVSSFRWGRRLRPLPWAPCDAGAMSRVARRRGFGVVTLVDREATVKNVCDEVSRAADALQRGDTFVLFFSGHGLAGSDRWGFQQSWCLFDDPLLRFGDDGLDALLARFREGVRIVVVANCCHASRDDGWTAPTPPIRANVIRIGACAAGEVAIGSSDPRRPSPFVQSLLDSMRVRSDDYRSLFERLPPSLDPPATPQLEIGQAESEQLLRAKAFRLHAPS